MVPKRRLFILIVFLSILAVVVTAYSFLRFYKNKPLGVSTEVISPRPAHQVRFFDEKTFYEGVNKTKDIKPLEYQVSGGIIPHDYFVGFIIAGFFKRLSSQKPSTIILLGPNHYEKGNFKVLTSLNNWNTPFGSIASDDLIIKALIESNLAKADEETLPNDHSVSGVMPFIKYYLPAIKVVPLMLSGSMTKDESEKLANVLNGLITKNIVVIAAVDFSHYLTSLQAQEKDKITSQVIGGFDYRQLYLMSNDYLDSPPSIGVLLMIMQKQNTTKIDLFYHTDLGQLQNNNNIQTTSYFSLVFH